MHSSDYTAPLSDRAHGSLHGIILFRLIATSSRSCTERAVDLAMAGFQDDIQRAEKTTGEVYVPPLSTYVSYHAAMLVAVAENSLTPDKIRQIDAQHDRLHEVIRGRPEARASKS